MKDETIWRAAIKARRPYVVQAWCTPILWFNLVDCLNRKPTDAQTSLLVIVM